MKGINWKQDTYDAYVGRCRANRVTPLSISKWKNWIVEGGIELKLVSWQPNTQHAVAQNA